MSELEPQAPWQGLPTVRDERAVPLPPDTLSETERDTIDQAAKAVLLDIEHPTLFPPAQDVYVAEPPHPAETSTR